MIKDKFIEDKVAEFEKIYNENHFTSKQYPSGKYRTKMEITNTIHPEKLKSFLRSALESQKEVMVKKVGKCVDEFSLMDWSGEGEVYAEIKRLKAIILSLIQE